MSETYTAFVTAAPAASPLAGTEPVAVIQGGITVKATVAQIAALSGIKTGESGGWNSTSALVVANTVPQDIVIPFACTLRQVIILTQGPGGSSVAGSCTVAMSHSSFASFPGSLVDMTGGAPPAISSSASPYSNTTFAGWTVTTFAQNDVIRLTLSASSAFASVKLILVVS
jgi:hypothetical protein